MKNLIYAIGVALLIGCSTSSAHPEFDNVPSTYTLKTQAERDYYDIIDLYLQMAENPENTSWEDLVAVHDSANLMIQYNQDSISYACVVFCEREIFRADTINGFGMYHTPPTE